MFAPQPSSPGAYQRSERSLRLLDACADTAKARQSAATKRRIAPPIGFIDANIQYAAWTAFGATLGVWVAQIMEARMRSRQLRRNPLESIPALSSRPEWKGSSCNGGSALHPDHCCKADKAGMYLLGNCRSRPAMQH